MKQIIGEISFMLISVKFLECYSSDKTPAEAHNTKRIHCLNSIGMGRVSYHLSRPAVSLMLD